MENEIEIIPSPHPAAAEVQKLVDRLSLAGIDEVIAYPELREIIGENPQQPRGRHIVARAVKKYPSEQPT